MYDLVIQRKLLLQVAYLLGKALGLTRLLPAHQQQVLFFRTLNGAVEGLLAQSVKSYFVLEVVVNLLFAAQRKLALQISGNVSILAISVCF